VFFIIVISALHVTGSFSVHHQELIKLYVQPWVSSCFPAVCRWCGCIVMPSYRLPLVWMGQNWKVPTRPHQRQRAGKHDNTQGSTYSFISS
jgi:hypothetical protein